MREAGVLSSTATDTATSKKTLQGSAVGSGSVGGGMEATRRNGAGRTFQSLFGSDFGSDTELLGERIQKTKGGKKEEEQDKEEGVEDREEEAEVWDDDFPADAEEDKKGRAVKPKLAHAIALESQRSMEDWADHDDDEDNWKEALQARVDQLELVVGRTLDAVTPDTTAFSNSSAGFSENGLTVPMPGTPVDQRATLTLLPKTNLSRAVSAPPGPEEHKPPSKLKAPNIVRATTMTTASSASGAKATSGAGNAEQVVARKRSNSRDFSARLGTLASDQKRLAKAATTTATTPSNSVFVRAVVARGASNSSRPLAEPTRISDGDGHTEKRAKSSDRRSSILALSDAEVVRRFILDDIKKISVERIVADAKRLHFLEDVYRRQQQQQPSQSIDANIVSSSSSSGASARHLSPTKKRMV